MLKASKYSPEAITALEMMEKLSENNRKYVLEKLRDIVADTEVDTNWDNLLKEHPEPMIKMASKALKEHKEGKSTPMNL
jgi:hypothetical protein